MESIRILQDTYEKSLKEKLLVIIKSKVIEPPLNVTN